MILKHKLILRVHAQGSKVKTEEPWKNAICETCEVWVQVKAMIRL
jgi:hypothetical protein